MTQSSHISLLEAVNQDDEKQFSYILEKEGLPRGKNWLDNDLLTKALRKQSKRCAAYLLEKRTRVVKNNDNAQLDRMVEKYGWGIIVEKLLKLESKMMDVNDKGDTVLHVAFVNQLPEYIIDLLLRHYMYETTMNVKNRNGLSFLHIASTRPNSNLVQEYLEINKSDVDCQVSVLSGSIYSGYTPLHFAVEYSRLDVLNCLLRYGATIYVTDFHGSTPLHRALECSDKEIINTLSYHDNRNENYINNFGLSHFMAACASNDSLIADQYLYVAEKTEPNSSTKLVMGRVKNLNDYMYACYTPLHFAAEFGELKTVQFLLAQGAHCCAVTSQNLTPTDLACKRGSIEICSELMTDSCSCKGNTSQKSESDEVSLKLETAKQSVVEQSSVREDKQVTRDNRGSSTFDKDFLIGMAFFHVHVVILVLIIITIVVIFKASVVEYTIS